MEIRQSYRSFFGSATRFRSLNISVWCYRGNVATPMWKDVDRSESHLTIIYLASLIS